MGNAGQPKDKTGCVYKMTHKAFNVTINMKGQRGLGAFFPVCMELVRT